MRTPLWEPSVAPTATRATSPRSACQPASIGRQSSSLTFYRPKGLGQIGVKLDGLTIGFDAECYAMCCAMCGARRSLSPQVFGFNGIA